MSAQQVPISKLTGARFARAVRDFASSEVGGKAKLLFAALIVFLLAISGLNVVNSYVGRDFMTAIEERSMSGFVQQALRYIGVFAASTVVAVIYRFTEERLGLLWREWLTRRLIGLYLEERTYYRLNQQLVAHGEIPNPDQRIADDVRTFTTMTISFVLLLLNGTLTALAFSGVLWSISPLLFGVAVSYAAVGSLLTVALGRPLVWLNYNQADQEANFRSTLVHVGANAESLALLRHERPLRDRLVHQLDGVVSNFRRIIAVNRNLGFFTTGYNYLIQIIPALIVAPLFIRGQMQFGVITQSAMAFGQLLGAFSLIVTQFQSISSFAAVVARLGSLAEGAERAHGFATFSLETCPHQQRPADCPSCSVYAKALPALPTITLCDADGRVAYEGLTLRLPPEGRIGVRALSVSIPEGTRTLVVGPDEAALRALYSATAGVWGDGEGRVLRPGADRVMFLPERPYVPAGTLHQLLAPPGGEPAAAEAIMAALRRLGVEPIVERADGFEVEQRWDTLLTLGEQQLLSAARLIAAAPRFALLYRIGTALSAEQVETVLSALSEHAITYIVFGQTEGLGDRHDALLELAADGSWTWTPKPT